MAQLNPSDNPVATALAIAFHLAASYQHKTAIEFAVEINKLVHAMLKDIPPSQLHPSK